MTDQDDRQDESLTGQVRDRAENCPLTDRYFQPCHSRLVDHCLTWDQALFFFLASLFPLLEREKNNVWYIRLTIR